MLQFTYIKKQMGRKGACKNALKLACLVASNNDKLGQILLRRNILSMYIYYVETIQNNNDNLR